MNLYWVSAIIQDKDDKKPHLLAMSSGETSIEKAMEVANRIKKTYIVLSIWIDTFDENDNKTTVFHDCYVNAFGNIMPN